MSDKFRYFIDQVAKEDSLICKSVQLSLEEGLMVSGQDYNTLMDFWMVINLGTYSNPTEAHMAYCYMAKHLRGEFANFENPTP